MKWNNNTLKDLKRQYTELLSSKFNLLESKRFLDILIEDFFNISNIRLALEPDTKLSESELLRLHFAVKDLLNDKPIQYITGISHFHDLKLTVNESVLIPRPETEELINLILNEEQSEGLKVIDVGTGSGCIAIVLKKNLRNADVTAIDVSNDAIKVAEHNTINNKLNIAFKQIDILKTDSFSSFPMFDIVVSNPPYVTQSDKKLMQKNVVDFEPSQALFVDDKNPLIFYIAILNFCQIHLKNGGRIYFEINEHKGGEMLMLFERFNYQDANIHRDVHGKERFITASKRN